MTSYKALLSHVSHQVVSGKVFRGEGGVGGEGGESGDRKRRQGRTK